MNRKQFATGSGIVIDVCRDHGTFFDGGELAAIVDYVVGGGLERSAKKDALQARQDRLRERANAMYDRLCAARSPKLLPPHRARDVAIADLFISLFD